MRISDWSSDVCSSDLRGVTERGNIDPRERFMSQPTILDGDADILLLCDHASNVVPEGITLGIAPELLDLHIAIDIGAEPLTRALAERLDARSEEHTSELQSLMRISYAVFCLKKKKQKSI